MTVNLNMFLPLVEHKLRAICITFYEQYASHFMLSQCKGVAWKHQHLCPHVINISIESNNLTSNHGHCVILGLGERMRTNIMFPSLP